MKRLTLELTRSEAMALAIGIANYAYDKNDAGIRQALDAYNEASGGRPISLPDHERIKMIWNNLLDIVECGK